MIDGTTLLDGALDRLPLLAGLDEPLRRKVAAIGESVSFKQGEIIVHQGRQSQRLWTLLEGQCEVLLHLAGRTAPVTLATLEPLATFGEMSFFQPAEHSASVRAKTPVWLLRIERDAFDKLAAADPLAAYRVSVNIIDSLANRLRRMDQWVADLVESGSAAPRVAELHQLREKLFNGWNF